jgi:small GTP-binding protein
METAHVERLVCPHAAPTEIAGMAGNFRPAPTSRASEDKLTIALYGSVNAGKSSLVNALLSQQVCGTSPRGGTTIETSSHRMAVRVSRRQNETGDMDSSFSMEALGVELIDTPGIAEAKGREREKVALDAARSAHLILFVVSGDITSHEILAFHKLFMLNKPLLLVLNQIDKYGPLQLAEIQQSIERKMGRVVGDGNFISVASSPLQHFIVVDVDGSERLEEKQGEPDVSALRRRIDEIVSDEGKHLLSLEATIREMESAKSQALKSSGDERRRIDGRADELIENFAVGMAIGVAVNPVPLLDLTVGLAGMATLVSQLAGTYGVAMSEREIDNIASVLGSASKDILAGSTAAYVGGSLLKFVPWVGWAAGGMLQAGAVGYTVTVLGRACKVYYGNGKKWDSGGINSTLENIVKSVDKDSVSGRIVHRVKQKLAI